MPAEWEPHSGTELHWPHNRETWPDYRLEKVETVYLNLIKELIKYDTIYLFVNDDTARIQIVAKLIGAGIPKDAVIFVLKRTNDVWARDCGPIFVLNAKNEPVILNWGYNAWGEKYPPFDEDNAIPKFVSDTFGVDLIESNMILEGGSIDVNGKGSLLTTKSVLLNKNRNPDLSQFEIEEKLKYFLGVTHIIWLNQGLAGDDTDGHIDDIARFVNEDTVITMVTDNAADVNYQALQENLAILKKARLEDGSKLKIVEIPMPMTKTDELTVDGCEFIPASYANFYIANDAVILPIYDKRYDNEVIEIFNSLFPKHKIIPIQAKDLVWGQGSFHCITQQWYKKI